MSEDKKKLHDIINEQKKIPFMHIFPYACIIIFLKLVFFFIIDLNSNQLNLIWEIPLSIIISLIGGFITLIATIVITISVGIVIMFIFQCFSFIAYITKNVEMLYQLLEAGRLLDRTVRWFLQGKEWPF